MVVLQLIFGNQGHDSGRQNVSVLFKLTCLSFIAMYDIRMCPGSKSAIEIVGCHAEGEVGDVIIKNVEAIPGPGTESWL